MAGFRRERRMQRDHVALAQDRLEVDELDRVSTSPFGTRIACPRAHVHADAASERRKARADAAESHQAERPATKLHPGQRLIPATGAQIAIQAAQVSGHRQHHRQGVLGHRVVGVTGRVAHGDAPLRRRVEIDEVSGADTEEGDELEIRCGAHDFDGKSPSEHDGVGVADSTDELCMALRLADVHRERSDLLDLVETISADEIRDLPVGIGVDDAPGNVLCGHRPRSRFPIVTDLSIMVAAMSSSSASASRAAII